VGFIIKNLLARCSSRRRNGGVIIKTISKVGLAVIIGIMIFSILGSNDPMETHYITVSVGRSDTVWGIAGKYVSEHQDIRDLVYEIQQTNHLNKNAEVQPGQQLKIPIKKSPNNTLTANR
jgi:LysM domain.